MSTKKMLIWMLAASALVGLGVPFALSWAMGFISGMLAAMYMVYPVLCGVMGVLAGRRIRSLWFMPLAAPVFTIPVLLLDSGSLQITLEFFFLYSLVAAIGMCLSCCLVWIRETRDRQ